MLRSGMRGNTGSTRKANQPLWRMERLPTGATSEWRWTAKGRRTDLVEGTEGGKVQRREHAGSLGDARAWVWLGGWGSEDCQRGP